MDQNHGNINCKTLTVDGFEAHSQQYTIEITSSTTWATRLAEANVYSISDGSGGTVWRIAFNIAGLAALVGDIGINITGIVFDSTPDNYQAITVAATGGGLTTGGAHANPGTSLFSAFSSVDKTLWSFSGDLKLNAKPLFVA